MKKKKLRLKRTIVKKIIILIIFTSVLSFLFYMTYYIYKETRRIEKYNKNQEAYSYLEIEKMSDKFAEIDNKEFHFVKDKYNVIYIISINSKKIDKYQSIIDYTYEKKDKPSPMKIYGLPVKVNKELKILVIENINKFLSFKEKMNIKEENYEEYMANTFLDTTITENYNFNYVVFLLFLIFGIIFLLLIKILFFKKIEEKSSLAS